MLQLCNTLYFGDQCKELSISCSVVKLLKTKISRRRRQEGRERGRAWAGRRGSWLTDWLGRRSWEQDCGQISWMHTRWPSLGNYPNNRASCFNLQSSALENNYSVQVGGHISFTLRGQRPASNLDVNILCGLDEPSPAHARPLVKRPGKSWSSGLALMMSRGAVFLLPRESSSCQCWHFCGRLSLSHLRTNIIASVKQSLPALKGRMDLRGTMPQKIQQEAF